MNFSENFNLMCIYFNNFLNYIFKVIGGPIFGGLSNIPPFRFVFFLIINNFIYLIVGQIQH
jgi:hypothetical protein